MAVVLVTGGSSGIGLATVRRLAAAGDHVFAASRNPTRGGLPAGVEPIVLDVGDPLGADAAIAAVVAAAGRLDALVNNAGTGSLGPVEEAGDAEAHRMFEVNVFGPMRLAVAAVPVMRGQGSGQIVNVTSLNDVFPAPFGGWYSASKAALASLSTVLDAEVHGFGISVSVIAPGLFRTEMAESLDSFAVADGSPYRAAFEALTAQQTDRIETAADPDLVAAAIEHCIHAAEPPARTVVGDDAKAMSKLVHDAAPDDFARLLRAYVADLDPS
jgi:NAD(P)-dependent dehydrogenase (short-subunit alcohol dehydrogenase family)